ncbi:MAG: T9SS type A sorting domain-containing protein [Bacteroidota bacterium]|nr:T9SS type A sorting domain-containing protein [Bacteroidota bacterium]
MKKYLLLILLISATKIFAQIKVDVGPDKTICKGQNVNLFATGCDTCKWNTGEISNSIIVSPQYTTTYKVTGTSNGVTSTDEIIISVKQLPKAYAGSDKNICYGTSATLSASGGISYSWDNGKDTSNITVHPETTSKYNVTVSDGNCSATSSVVVYVNYPGTVNAGENQTICKGSSALLSATGGINYCWSNSNFRSEQVVYPTTTTNYKVTATNSENCTAADSVIVYVIPQPTITITPEKTICNGKSTELTASGGIKYKWNTTSKDTTASITVNPTTSYIYYVTVTSINGCTSSSFIKINVTNVNAYISGKNKICSGKSTNLTGSGGGTYSWSTGNTSQTISIKPTATTTYSLTTTLNGCTESSQIIISIINVDINISSDRTICKGDTAIISVSGGGSYVWNTGHSTSTIKVVPTTSSTYIVTVYNYGCSNSAKSIINVTDFHLNAGSDLTINKGQTITLKASAQSGIPYTYLWSTGESSSSIKVTPTNTTTYKVTISNGICSESDNVVLTINTPCTISVNAGPDLTINNGQSITLKANATGGLAYSYKWNTGDTTSSITVKPSNSYYYYVTVKEGKCTATDYVFIKVNTVGINENYIPFTESIVIFPNPATNKINIMFGKPIDNDLNLRILNYIGETVGKAIIKTTSYPSYKLNTSELPHGLYYIEFENKELHFVRKFIKE